MKGLLIWADSYCRSTLAFYDGIGKSFGVPCRIVVMIKSCDNRLETGFSKDEFKHLDLIFLDEIEDLDAFINSYKGYHHIFGAYQKNNGCRDIIRKVQLNGDRFAISSEAPCNLFGGIRRILKVFYLRYVLPMKVRDVVKGADFILNLSGDMDSSLLRIGWKKHQIVHCGYYSPALPNTHAVKRDDKSWSNFVILLTGRHEFHRSPMVLLKALHILDQKGLSYSCHITQKGPLLPTMQEYAAKHKMENVIFEGFMPLEDLNRLYCNCSVFVGVGSNEPWGIRLNDALNCGAPLVASTGMGGVKLVDDYECGLSFPRGNHKALASQLEKLILNKDLYLRCAEKAFTASQAIDPYNKAKEIADYIREKFSGWK